MSNSSRCAERVGLKHLDPVIADPEQAIGLELLDDLVDLDGTPAERSGEDSLADGSHGETLRPATVAEKCRYLMWPSVE